MTKRKAIPKAFDKPLAWVCETYEQNGVTEVRVVREGMLREEIIQHFPPRKGDEHGYNRMALVRTIIYEAYLEAKNGVERPRKNVRGFTWYERLMYTLMTVMGESGDSDNINTINTTAQIVWRGLVEGGYVTYRAMNIYSEKEDLYNCCVVEDSPYPGTIVQVEKASLYGPLHDLANVYQVSFCAAGGNDSAAAAMEFTHQLEEKGIDLGRDFTVYSFNDFDPDGWDIPETFIKHLKYRITGDIKLVRLGVLREQIGDSVVKYQAVPYSLEAKTRAAQKAKQTSYNKFVVATGGLFIPGPNGEMMPARVELDIYTDEQIRDRIIEGLCKHLEGFEYQVRALKWAIEHGYDQAQERAGKELGADLDRVYRPYYEALEKEQERLQEKMALSTVSEDRQIAALNDEIERLERVKAEKTSDLRSVDERLEQLGHTINNMRLREWNRIGIECETELSDLIDEVESNGGWRSWADELGIDGDLGTDDLVRFGRQRKPVSWSASWDDRQAINAWVREHVDFYWPDPDGPDKTPKELIEEALNDDSDD